MRDEKKTKKGRLPGHRGQTSCGRRATRRREGEDKSSPKVSPVILRNMFCVFAYVLCDYFGTDIMFFAVNLFLLDVGNVCGHF